MPIVLMVQWDMGAEIMATAELCLFPLCAASLIAANGCLHFWPHSHHQLDDETWLSLTQPWREMLQSHSEISCIFLCTGHLKIFMFTFGKYGFLVLVSKTSKREVHSSSLFLA